MDIELREITVRELTEGYKDKEEMGVVGYGGHLDIRPPYQREFIYGDVQREAVVDTITRGFPLNVNYNEREWPIGRMSWEYPDTPTPPLAKTP